MAIKQYYDLNLVPRDVPVVVQCSQYDKKSRQIVFTIYKDEELYTIPNGVGATVRGTKRDKTGFVYSCTCTSHTITMTIEEQMTVLSGYVPCELRITRGTLAGTEILGTANFSLYVEKSPLADDTIISETDIPLLQQAVEAYDIATDALNEVQGMEDSVQEAYDMAVAAKAAADAITVDDALSTTSENPVQNKVITEAFTPDNELSTTSEKPVQNKVIKNKIDEIEDHFVWKSLSPTGGQMLTADYSVTIPEEAYVKEIEIIVCAGGNNNNGLYSVCTFAYQNFAVPVLMCTRYSDNYYVNSAFTVIVGTRTITVLKSWTSGKNGSSTFTADQCKAWVSYR